MMTTGTLFPAITPRVVYRISAPALLLLGARSYPFLGVIGRKLGRRLPRSRTIVFPDAGHQMWLQDPEACRNDVEEFLAGFGIREIDLIERSWPRPLPLMPECVR
jgi:pimeloyl-ACP methyl ester carboxylesterase